MFGMQRQGMFGSRQLPDPMTAAPRLPQFQQSLMAPPDAPQMPQQAPRDPYAPATGLRRVVGILGDFASGMAGGQANFAQSQQQLAAERRQIEQRRQLAELEASQPMVRTVGNQVVRIDPRTGQSTVLHTGQDSAQARFFEDNAGNQWTVDPATQQPRLVFRDPTPRYQLVPGVNAQGDSVMRQVEIPNNVPAPGAAPRATSDLPPGFQIDPAGGQGGPAPVGANRPVGGRMTRAQVAAVIASMGGDRSAFDRWIQQHNIQIVD